MKNKDYYYILGLKHNASLSEIKESFRKLSLKFHPDKNVDDDGSFWTNRFIEIKEAYDTLSNEKKRKEYDLQFNKQTIDKDTNIDYDNEFAFKIENSVKLYNEKKVLYEKYYRNLQSIYPKQKKMTIAKWITSSLIFILLVYLIKPSFGDINNLLSNTPNSFEFLTSESEVYVYSEPDVKSDKIGLFKELEGIKFIGETNYFYKIILGDDSYGFVRKKEVKYNEEFLSENIKGSNSNEEIFEISKRYNVIVDKAFFYDKPSLSSMRDAYLVKDEIISATRISSDFVYAEFINSKNTKSVGWIKLNNLEVINIKESVDVDISIEDYFIPTSLPDNTINYCYKNDCNSNNCAMVQRKTFYILRLESGRIIIEHSFVNEVLSSEIKYKIEDNSIVAFESNTPALKLIGENPNRDNYRNVTLKAPGNTWVEVDGRETTTYNSYWGTYGNNKCIVVEERVKFIIPNKDEKEIEKVVAKSFYVKDIGLVYYSTFLKGIQNISPCIEYR